MQIAQHQTLQDRITAAQTFQRETNFELPLAVDPIHNPFNELYSAWPERAYIVQQGKIEFVSMADKDGGMDWENGVVEWCTRHCS